MSGYTSRLDEIDKWLFDSFGILPGCCSSQENIRHTTARMIAEALWPKKDLGWHSVKESLPPMNEEVIVLTDNIHGKIVPNAHYICYGHIVDKNIAVDYNGWNIPGVTYWMYLPEIKEQ